MPARVGYASRTQHQKASAVNSVKLYERLLANPKGVISFRNFESLLRAFGFHLDRTTGSHRQYVHRQVPRSFPVQPDGKDAKRVSGPGIS
jgi:hypothetical protein